MDTTTAVAPVDTSKVPGWGVDADPKNDPTYPYRDRSRDPGLSADWKRPPQQQPDVEILRSIEHNRLPAVFGTSTPPRWVSGMMRRAAFRWSESNWIHWLMLMGADRVNVVEGVVQDLARARIPNIPAEMGIKSALRHNKTGMARKAAIAVGVSAVIYGLMKMRSSGERDRLNNQSDYDG